MKYSNNYLLWLFSIVVILGLNGCKITGEFLESEQRLFLVDERGFAYEGIPYKCDSMSYWSQTAPNGEFIFSSFDSCKFDFRGLYGNIFNDPLFEDIIRIVDDMDRGRDGISYECQSFIGGMSHIDGSFEYDRDDQCLFYL